MVVIWNILKSYIFVNFYGINVVNIFFDIVLVEIDILFVFENL